MINKHTVPVNLPVSYLRYGGASGASGRPVLLMLHGFRETARDFVARAFDQPEGNFPFEIFAPNAPFPMPARLEGKYVEAYSWYFRDIDRKSVLIPPEVAAEALLALMTDLDLARAVGAALPDDILMVASGRVLSLLIIEFNIKLI